MLDWPGLRVLCVQLVQLVVERPDALGRRDVLRDPRQVATVFFRAVERFGKPAREVLAVGCDPWPQHGDQPTREERTDDLSAAILSNLAISLWLQRGFLAQDRCVELLERRARLDPQLVDERAAGFLIGAKRLGLAPRPVEREHQLAAEPLAERILLDEALQLADELGCRATFEIGLDSIFEGRRAKLFEAGDLGFGERLEGEVGKWGAAPQPERFAKLLAASFELERPRPGNESLELIEVDCSAATFRR